METDTSIAVTNSSPLNISQGRFYNNQKKISKTKTLFYLYHLKKKKMFLLFLFAALLCIVTIELVVKQPNMGF